LGQRNPCRCASGAGNSGGALLTALEMQKATLILVRHGESEGNRDRTFTQSPAVPITERGKRQAEAAAEFLAEHFRPHRLISSPYLRARQTAEILSARLCLPVEEDEAFREQSFGIFAGKPYEALVQDAAYAQGPRWAWRPEGGESLEDVARRAVPAALRVAAESVGQEVVIVSHGGVMLALAAHANGGWEGLSVAPNGGILVVEFAGGILHLGASFAPASALS